MGVLDSRPALRLWQCQCHGLGCLEIGSVLAAKGESELSSRLGLYVVRGFLDAPSIVPAALVTHINWVHRLFRIFFFNTIEGLVEELMFVSCHFKVHLKTLAVEIVTFNSHYTVTFLLLLSVMRWLLSLLGRLLEAWRI